MSRLPTGPRPNKNGKLYADGMTKQSFKDQCDLNKIIQKAARTGTLSHLQRHGAEYGDFSDVPSLLEAHERIQRGNAIFAELPAELRREFGNNAFDFFAFVNDPANADRLREVLPGLAQPGQQLPAVRRSAGSQANPALASAEDPASSAPVQSASPQPTSPADDAGASSIT